MFDYMMEAYGTETPDDVKKALQEKYRLEMKVQNLEQMIKYSAPNNFEALMQQIELERTELCAMTERANNLLSKWRYERATKDWQDMQESNKQDRERRQRALKAEMLVENWKRFH